MKGVEKMLIKIKLLGAFYSLLPPEYAHPLRRIIIVRSLPHTNKFTNLLFGVFLACEISSRGRPPVFKGKMISFAP